MKFPMLLGVLYGAMGMASALCGYGYALVYIWPLILTVFLVSAIPALIQKRLLRYGLHVVVISVIATGLWHGGTVVRKTRKSLQCHEMNALINRVQAYHRKMGVYPAQLDDLHFSTRLSLKSGIFKETGVDLDGMNDHDAAVNLGTNGFICIVPVTKMLPISITRFYAYIWTSDDSAWRYDHTIWTIGKI